MLNQAHKILFLSPAIEAVGATTSPFGPVSSAETFRIVKITATVNDVNPDTWKVEIADA